MPRLLLLVLCCCQACSSIPDGVNPAPFGQIVVMTYNIHHGAGSDGSVDLARIARVILSANPDLVALQEVDRFVERTEKTDQAQILADLTGMHMRFAFAIPYQGGDFGNVVLSRHPITSFTTLPLPGDPGENRVLVEITIQWPDESGALHPVRFYSTHLDTFKEPREAAARIVLDTLRTDPQTLTIFAGDLNDGPTSTLIQSFATRLTTTTPTPILTFPADNPDRQLDYLFFNPSPQWQVARVFVMQEPVASDHVPLVVWLQRGQN